jgi:fatty-acyl-CoA synthase
MRGLMMDGPLTLDAVLRRAETIFPDREVVSRLGPAGRRRTTWGEVADRARRLAGGLARLGVAPGDRVATLGMNSDRHLEMYFAAPLAGAVLHTVNPRLHPDDLAYIVSDAGDRALMVDADLLPVLESFRERVDLRHVIVAGGDAGDAGVPFEEVLDDAPLPAREPDERDAAALCYTSGTTGRPKGVLYSHRALVLHSLVSAHGDAFDVRESDTVMPVVPMFHVMAWGLPFTCSLTGAAMVMPGRWLDSASVLAAIVEEGVTITAGVPTVWLAVLDALDAEPGARDLSRLRSVIVGGSAAPAALLEGLGRHGVPAVHAWGMTELTPLGTISRLPPDVPDGDDAAFALRAAQGRPIPFVEIRARGIDGPVPWDGRAMGELEVRGPWVAGGYFGASGDPERFTDDGWFRTGDVVTIDPRGCVRITDREKDLVKSGGEWISSVALENALMAHPDVSEAAVIAVADPRWQERPLAVVVLREGRKPDPDALREHLRPDFAPWWLPDRYEFVEAIPRTATGKFKKSDLRTRFGA